MDSRSIKHILQQDKVFVRDHEDNTKTYFYTTRKFLGNTGPFSSKEERSFEQRHLKAYLKGQKEFYYHKRKCGVMVGVVIHEIPTDKIEAYFNASK